MRTRLYKAIGVNIIVKAKDHKEARSKVRVELLKDLCHSPDRWDDKVEEV